LRSLRARGEVGDIQRHEADAGQKDEHITETRLFYLMSRAKDVFRVNMRLLITGNEKESGTGHTKIKSF
jgi:hypothetical protein